MVGNISARSGDAGDTGLIPGWGGSPGGGNSNPFQYSCLEHPMDRGDKWAPVHGISKKVRQDLKMCVPM